MKSIGSADWGTEAPLSIDVPARWGLLTTSLGNCKRSGIGTNSRSTEFAKKSVPENPVLV